MLFAPVSQSWCFPGDLTLGGYNDVGGRYRIHVDDEWYHLYVEWMLVVCVCVCVCVYTDDIIFMLSAQAIDVIDRITNFGAWVPTKY